MSELNLLNEQTPPAPNASQASVVKPFTVTETLNLDQQREAARGDLARGLLWLLTFAIGGVLVFVGVGRLEGTVISQSIFPSLVALAGTALGFYFGSSSAKSSDSGTALLNSAAGAGNRTPPAANAGPDQTVTVGATVSLRGSGSAGPNGTQLTYAWTLTTIPAGSSATLSGADSSSASFLADQPGTYAAQLIVNDGLASTPSTTNITAVPVSTPIGAGNLMPPVANAGPDQTAKVGATVTLSGSGSGGASGTPFTYLWTLKTIPTGSKATLTGADSASPTFVADQPGIYVAELIVNNGSASPPSTTNITAS